MKGSKQETCLENQNNSCCAAVKWDWAFSGGSWQKKRIKADVKNKNIYYSQTNQHTGVILYHLDPELMTLRVFCESAGFKLDSNNIHMNVLKREIIAMMMS